MVVLFIFLEGLGLKNYWEFHRRQFPGFPRIFNTQMEFSKFLRLAQPYFLLPCVANTTGFLIIPSPVSRYK